MIEKTITMDQMTVTVSLSEVEAPLDLVAALEAQMAKDLEKAFYGFLKPDESTVGSPPAKKATPKRPPWPFSYCST